MNSQFLASQFSDNKNGRVRDDVLKKEEYKMKTNQRPKSTDAMK